MYLYFLFFPFHFISFSRWKVRVFGHSIVRGLDQCLNREFLDFQVTCLPGAKIRTVSDHVSKLNPANDKTGIDAVVIHVGTNNLNCSVWNLDKNSYVDLYSAVRSQYENAKMIFSGIIPRWDSQDLYEKALYYNIHLHSLCTTFLECRYIEVCEVNYKFVIDNRCFRWDGLHLINYGRKVFGDEL